ncbi:hypothetical protein [Spirosoma spitsbergense]|uniref:hypothetical protein n=1 Tax=Spirosoma spitsbergense TaxID=431554 RepID=UPI00036C7336|nr:hypothetical protein [Spirosoma spitsbergense]
MRALFFVSLLIGASIVFYFSWLPKPNLGTYRILPDWLSHWTDVNDNMNVRTAVPFFIMGVSSGYWLSSTGQAWINWFWLWLLLIAVVSIAEAGQLLLPLRHFDWGDIAWGSAGAFIGLLPLGLLRLVNHKRHW